MIAYAATAGGLGLPKSILVIDDEESIRLLLDEYLEILGFRVRSVSSGPEGLEALETEDFGLVICDVSMPGMDGFQVYEEILNQKPEQPLVFITGYALTKQRQHLLEKSLGLLRKPFHLNELNSFLSNIFPDIPRD